MTITPPRTRKSRLARARLLGFRLFKKPVILAHRWTSLVLGLLLLFITTTGAVVVYAPELTRLEYPAYFSTTQTTHPVDATEALAAVKAVDPTFEVEYWALSKGVYRFSEAGDERAWGVDAGTGRVTGHINPDQGIVGWFENAHECFFSCEGFSGYVGWLSATVPGSAAVLSGGATWASLLLVVGGFLLLFLVVSGIVIWWPKLGRIARSFTVRRGKGRYARDFDLHQLIGIIALPFLLMWAITGIGFELPVVSDLWYQATGGTKPVEATFASDKAAKGTPDITLAQAEAAAMALYPTAEFVAYVGYPEKTDAKGYFDVWISTPNDTWANGLYPGEREVAVDRHDATRAERLTPEPTTVSNYIWDEWSQPLAHYGLTIDSWWRWIWVAFGLTPLALALTGVSTWLYKRRVAKLKRARKKQRLVDAEQTESAVLDEEIERASQELAPR